MSFFLLKMPPGTKSPKGKNRIPGHQRWGLTLIELDREGLLLRYMHENGGWFDLDDDPDAPLAPMVYSTISGANKALSSAKRSQMKGETHFAVWTAAGCEEPKSKASFIAKYLETEIDGSVL